MNDPHDNLEGKNRYWARVAHESKIYHCVIYADNIEEARAKLKIKLKKCKNLEDMRKYLVIFDKKGTAVNMDSPTLISVTYKKHAGST